MKSFLDGVTEVGEDGITRISVGELYFCPVMARCCLAAQCQCLPAEECSLDCADVHVHIMHGGMYMYIRRGMVIIEAKCLAGF